MNEKIHNRFLQYQAAKTRLREAVQSPGESDIKRDAVIQRFEFTYELLWKLFKAIAIEEKMECYSPKTAFQAAFKINLIDDERLFVEIIDARNSTTHLYSEEDSKVIYAFIKEKVLAAFDQVEQSIQRYMDQNQK